MITPRFWLKMGFTEEPDVKKVLSNLSKAKITYKNFIKQNLTIIVRNLKL